jgi:hypothetical protein
MNFAHCLTNSARHRVLKFCKNAASYGVYKLADCHWNQFENCISLRWFQIECHYHQRQNWLPLGRFTIINKVTTPLCSMPFICKKSIKLVRLLSDVTDMCKGLLVSHRGGPRSNPGLVKWDLRWTKWHWGRFSPSTSVSPANLHSTKFSIIKITRGRYNRPFSGRRAEWTQFGLHPPLCECH